MESLAHHLGYVVRLRRRVRGCALVAAIVLAALLAAAASGSALSRSGQGTATARADFAHAARAARLLAEGTGADFADAVIAPRAAFFRIADGRLVPARTTDNSYKWAGGGFLSTADDLVRFGTGQIRGLLTWSTSQAPLRILVVDRHGKDLQLMGVGPHGLMNMWLEPAPGGFNGRWDYRGDKGDVQLRTTNRPLSSGRR